jgi:uncharacterized protein YcbX
VADQPVPIHGVVTALATTPVKGLRLLSRSEVMLTEVGAADNRCFFLIDDRARMVNGKRIPSLSAVVARYDAGDRRLELRFPDGTGVDGEAPDGEAVETRFFSEARSARLVRGPFSAALTEYASQGLRLVRADPSLGAVDRGPRGAVSLISQASVRRLSGLAGEEVDPRRFRMLIEVAGPGAHEEDSLVGARARIGDALLAIHGHVGRCLVTSQHPETGEVDLPTLELLSYRRGLETTEPLAFGVYGEVVEPGLVRVGDTIASV